MKAKRPLKAANFYGEFKTRMLEDGRIRLPVRVTRSSVILRVLLPNGNTCSAAPGRANTAAFLELAQICPDGYGPGSRDYFPYLGGAGCIEFLVTKPQNMAMLLFLGLVDACVCFGDVIAEASESGLTGIQHLLELPFGRIKLVLVVRQDSPFESLTELLGQLRTPISCFSEYPHLTRKAIVNDPAYQICYGELAPTVQDSGGIVREGCREVCIIKSEGSSEPLVTAEMFDAAVVVSSSGSTISDCELKVIKTIGVYQPGLFCRPNIWDDPKLATTLKWFAGRLDLASRKWKHLQE